MILILFLILVFLLGFISIFKLSGSYKNISFSITLSAAMPFGIGISSLIFFVLNSLHLPIWLIVFLQFLLTIMLFYFTNDKANIFPDLTLSNQLDKFLKSPLLIILSAFFFNALLINIFIFIEENIREPHGIWDAWSYWNLKAKFIARAPFEWQNLFLNMRSVDFHLDYPLLQTGFIAQCWMILGNESVLVPMFSAFVFTMFGVFVLSSVISHFSNAIWGIIAGLILLCTPFYVSLGDSQYADTTVGFYMLLSFIFLALHYSAKDKNYFLILTAISCGMAAWSKNEGLLFSFVLLSIFVIIDFFEHKKISYHHLKQLSIGFLPIILIVLYYKSFCTPPNDLIEQSQNTTEKLSDWSRYSFIATWFVDIFKSFGRWAFNIWWIFLACALLLGFNLKNNTSLLIIGILSFILMLILFFFVYVNSYIDLTFHLSTSLHRLYFQLFPSFIFLYMFYIDKKLTKIE